MRAGGLVGAWQSWREAPAGGRLAGRAPEWGPSCPAQATVLSPFRGGSQGAGISTKASFAPPELISSPVSFSAKAGVLRVASRFTAGPVIVTAGFPAIPPGGHSFPSASPLRSLPPLSSPLRRCPPPLWTSWPRGPAHLSAPLSLLAAHPSPMLLTAPEAHPEPGASPLPPHSKQTGDLRNLP